MDTTGAERLQRWPQGSVAGHGERNAKPGGRRHCQVISFVGLHGRDDQKAMPGELGCSWRWDDRWGDHTDLFDGNAVRRGSTACGDPGDRGPTIDAAGSATVDAAQHSRRGADGGAGEGREPRDGALQVMPDESHRRVQVDEPLHVSRRRYAFRQARVRNEECIELLPIDREWTQHGEGKRGGEQRLSPSPPRETSQDRLGRPGDHLRAERRDRRGPPVCWIRRNGGEDRRFREHLGEVGKYAFPTARFDEPMMRHCQAHASMIPAHRSAVAA